MDFTLAEDGIVYSLQHTDEVRADSTSGGAFTALSDLLLLDGGYIAGAGYDDNMHVVHKLVNTSDDRNQLRGSKYVQSTLGNVPEQIRQKLENGLPVLFVGTPCQVKAVQQYLLSFKTNLDKFYCCDFVCAGVTSPMIQQEYIRILQGKRHIIDYNYRSKKKGWGVHSELPVFDDHKQNFNQLLVASNQKLFGSHYTLRPSCYRCQFANLNRCSDITMGDCWGIDACDPKSNDRKGLSLILVNTEKGQKMMKRIADQWEDVQIKRYKLDKLLQPRLQCPNEIPAQREKFWFFYQKHGLKATMRKYAGYNLKGALKTYFCR